MEKGRKVLKAPAGVYVPKGIFFNPQGKLDDQIPQSDWLICTITSFGAIVTQCRLTPQAHYEGKSHLVTHSALPALLRNEKYPDKVALMAMMGMLARSEPFLPAFWELVPTSPTEMPLIIWQALQFFHHAYDRPIRVQEVAKLCYVNYAHFCRLFRQWVGVTPLAYLVRLRMSAAWKLLTETSLPTTVVASLVGYSKWSLFSSQFSRIFGISPMKARKSASPEP
ncbi:MAG: helix-turn-helix transcriptional regulator [Candidatus Fervidibacter sp.]|uniref:helix-turn-helix transcriptional regulator n=1 Tax=Candidatus Fervidibacter sp. TaxID=3100871 RepID=UPI00404A5572